MGKRRRNHRKRWKAHHKPVEIKYEDWFRPAGKSDQNSYCVAHRGKKRICNLGMINFSFERSVRPYRELGSMTHNFQYGDATASGSFDVSRVALEAQQDLLREPFDVVMAQNGQITSNMYCVQVIRWDGDRFDFNASRMVFHPVEPKRIPKGYVPNHKFYDRMGRVTPSLDYNPDTSYAQPIEEILLGDEQ
jgi:hypothetical protein